MASAHQVSGCNGLYTGARSRAAAAGWRMSDTRRRRQSRPRRSTRRNRFVQGYIPCLERSSTRYTPLPPWPHCLPPDLGSAASGCWRTSGCRASRGSRTQRGSRRGCSGTDGSCGCRPRRSSGDLDQHDEVGGIVRRGEYGDEQGTTETSGAVMRQAGETDHTGHRAATAHACRRPRCLRRTP
eukprot:scaffold13305_cov124-Isochrysis_galbana.AAC.2